MRLATFTSWLMATKTHSPYMRAPIGTSMIWRKRSYTKQVLLSTVQVLSLGKWGYSSDQRPLTFLHSYTTPLKLNLLGPLSIGLHPQSQIPPLCWTNLRMWCRTSFPEIWPRAIFTSLYCVVSDRSSWLHLSSSPYLVFNCIYLCYSSHALNLPAPQPAQLLTDQLRSLDSNEPHLTS